MKRLSRLLCIMVMTVLFTCICFEPVQAKVKNRIAISDKKISLKVGDEYQLSISGLKLEPKWTSSNSKVATVSDKGLVVAVSYGKTKITGKCYGKKYSCEVVVRRDPTTTLTLNNDIYSQHFLITAEEMLDINIENIDDSYINLTIDSESYDAWKLQLENDIEAHLKEICKTDSNLSISHDKTFMKYNVSCPFYLGSSDGVYPTVYMVPNNRDNLLNSAAEDIFLYAYLTVHNTDKVAVTFYNSTKFDGIHVADSFNARINELDSIINNIR